MSSWLWVAVLLAAAWAAHWGAEKAADILQRLRRQWGLTGVAGAAIVALASGGTEVGVNVSSALTGVAGIGFGNLFGATILSIPLMVSVAYWGSRQADGQSSGMLRLDRQAVTVQALPYLAIVALAALLTVPAPWRGLQPVDGWIMLAAYLAYLAQALLRGRQEREPVEWTKKAILLAVAGVAALIVGAYLMTRATENIVSALGLSKVIGGLFITATVSKVPDVFVAWSLAKRGQATAAATAVLADNAVAFTIAAFPLALVTVPVENFRLFWVNMVFVALLPAAYAALATFGQRETGFKLWHTFVLIGIYVVYLAVVLGWVLHLIPGA